MRIGALVEPRDFIPKRLILLALTIGYIYLVTFLGFTITNFLFLVLTMLLLGNGRNKKRVFVVAAVLALGGWLLFIYAFDTSFPAGPFEKMMQELL
jgi:signal transduction histidine kinase